MEKENLLLDLFQPTIVFDRLMHVVDHDLRIPVLIREQSCRFSIVNGKGNLLVQLILAHTTPCRR